MADALKTTTKRHRDVADVIEAVALAQLNEFRNELLMSQIKLIAHQVAMEAARRLVEIESK